MLVSKIGYSQSIDPSLLADWSLKLDSGLPAWMSVQRLQGKPVVYLRLYVGGLGPYRDVSHQNGRLKFKIKKRQRKNKPGDTFYRVVEFGLTDGKLAGTVSRHHDDGRVETDAFTGTKIPPMPTSAPNLDQVKFGQRISLFNGKDLSGWRPHDPDKKLGWAAVDGLLKNTTPKTDFSATGAYANLETEAQFEDFRLHLEFLVQENRNSGVYLRGMYEAQVVDRDSRMQGIAGVGAIFGTVAPSKNAGKPGGQWQSYDLTLVDRHITVVLNGETVIDNQPVPRPTAGAVKTNPAKPGPIYLQGDHTSVAYRNIYLQPVVKP